MATVDLLVAEIGSTTTVVSAFDKMDGGCPVLMGQGQAPTTVLNGDVTLGLQAAIDDLAARAGQEVTWREMAAASSAAGGLKMTVHGLVYDMTVRAAREAALGAGANIHWVTAGELSRADVHKIEAIRPNIILLAGGVDYGEKATVLANARHLAGLKQPVPVIFAGNTAAAPEAEDILRQAGFTVTVTENVYPGIDRLNVEPTRRIIHDVFETHIVEAPGMTKIRQLVSGRIIPTPGAVMRAAVLLRENIGDLVVLDVGGATTDVHSVAETDPEVDAIMTGPEPTAKRTVEGDLGVYVNAPNVLKLCDQVKLCAELGCRPEELADLSVPLPSTPQQLALAEALTAAAVQQAVARHAGVIEYLYGPTGRMAVARGKDLTSVRWIVGTGGALTRLAAGIDILAAVNSLAGTQLRPRHAGVLIDNDYIMAAAGVMADRYPEAALALMRRSLGL